MADPANTLKTLTNYLYIGDLQYTSFWRQTEAAASGGDFHQHCPVGEAPNPYEVGHDAYKHSISNRQPWQRTIEEAESIIHCEGNVLAVEQRCRSTNVGLCGRCGRCVALEILHRLPKKVS